jgi:hypothetical protein
MDVPWARQGWGKLCCAALVMAAGLRGSQPANTVTFDNRSGEHALVKLTGPSPQTVEVAQGSSATVNVAAGKYYLLVRYGTKPQRYRYAQGDSFTVTETPTQRSAVTITLYPVAHGNYATRPISQREFEAAGLAPKRSTTKPSKSARTAARPRKSTPKQRR